MLCFSFFAVELAGGMYAHSLALIADAYHLLTDAAAYLISLIAIIIAQRKATKVHGFGFARAEVLGALASIILIWVLITVLMIEAVEKFKHPPETVNGVMMLVLSVCGLIVNILLLTVLNSGNEHHQKDGQQNINVRAAIIHAVGDLICSTGVIVASVVIIVNPELKWIDPACTFLFSLMVLFTTLKVLKEITTVLMQGSTFDTTQIMQDITKLPSVVGEPILLVWHLTSEELIATCHVLVENIHSLHVQRQIINILELNGIKKHTIQLNIKY